VSDLLPKKNGISIPGHPTINGFTAGNILDDLESDRIDLLALLEEGERNDEQSKGLPATTVRKNGDTG
jgi:hypothetical protein